MKTVHPFAEVNNDFQKVSNVVFREIMPRLDDPSVFVVLCFFLDRTKGRNKSSVTLTIDDIRQGTKIKDHRTIERSIKKLISESYIKSKGRKNGSKYVTVEINEGFAVQVDDQPSKTYAKNAKVEGEPMQKMQRFNEEDDAKNVKVDAKNVKVSDETYAKNAKVEKDTIDARQEHKDMRQDPPTPQLEEAEECDADASLPAHGEEGSQNTTEEGNEEQTILFIPDNNNQVESYYTPDFELFWKTWPKHERKRKKKATFDAWNKIQPSVYTHPELIRQIIEAVERQKMGQAWMKDNQEWIPLPTSWINARGWEDHVEPYCPPKSQREARNTGLLERRIANRQQQENNPVLKALGGGR